METRLSFSMREKEKASDSRLGEAPVGFEPTNKGFADLPLRPLGYSAIILKNKIHKSGLFLKVSGKRDSNPRHQPWQGCALPTELFPHSK